MTNLWYREHIFMDKLIGASCLKIECRTAKLFKFFLGSYERERTIVYLPDGVDNACVLLTC